MSTLLRLLIVVPVGFVLAIVAAGFTVALGIFGLNPSSDATGWIVLFAAWTAAYASAFAFMPWLIAVVFALATSEPPKKVSKQCFHLFPKIREIDRLMTPALEARVHEAHPELAFWRLNGERPMALPKKVKSRPYPPGIEERAELLSRHGYDRAFLDQTLPRGVGRDDLLDAAALALTAERIAKGEALSFPPSPERDGRGLRMAIWA